MLDSANGITTVLDAGSSFSIRRLDIIDGVKATHEELARTQYPVPTSSPWPAVKQWLMLVGPESPFL
jgi:hypothetical protein